MTAPPEFTYLRQTIPISGSVLIIGATSIFCLYAAITMDPKFAFPALLMWLYPIYIYYLNRSYKVGYNREGIVMRASGIKPVFMAYANIQRLVNEISISPGRPLRRLAIYTDDSNAWIDVSSKHFKAESISTLIDKIKIERPDLDIEEQA